MAFVFKKINKSIDKCKKSTTVNNNNNKDNNAITNHSLLERTKRTLERKKIYSFQSYTDLPAREIKTLNRFKKIMEYAICY